MEILKVKGLFDDDKNIWVKGCIGDKKLKNKYLWGRLYC